MSTPVTFITKDTATPALAHLGELLNSAAGRRAAGRGVRNTVIDHLRLKNLQPNKNNWPKTDFYGKAADSVSQPAVDAGGATITIDAVGIRQRLLGGTIVPKSGKKYLTIPAVGIAYGRRASEFVGVIFAFVRNDEGFLCPALVAGEAGASLTGTKPRRKKGASKPPISADQVIFWLVKSVTQKPDPSVLPTVEQLQAGGRAGLTSFYRSRIKNRSARLPGEEQA